MQPFARAAAALKAVAWKAVELASSAQAASALEALTQGQGRLREDEVLGMQLLRRKDYPTGRFTLAFVGYGDERDNTVLELTHNWDTEDYALGDGYGHIALGLDDIYLACTAIAEKGGRVVREPGPMKHGNTVIAFVDDPDGYKVELIQLSSRSDAA